MNYTRICHHKVRWPNDSQVESTNDLQDYDYSKSHMMLHRRTRLFRLEGAPSKKWVFRSHARRERCA